MLEAGEVIELDRDHLLALVQSDAELSEIFMRAFILRRVELIAQGIGDVVVVGSHHSAGTLRIREFLTRNGHPHAYVDVEREKGVQVLLETARHVHMLVRAGGLAETMSRYLIRRIEENPAITLRTRTEIVALEGEGAKLERVQWRNNETGAVETKNIGHVFTMAGAKPNTEWLGHCVALDAQGFIKTGPDSTREDLATAHWPLPRAPHLFETSLPGVFAVGDVRGGSIKRVASAVGEGSIAVAFVHRVLHE